MHKCKTHGRALCVRCVLFTFGFPVEHFLWERTPLRIIAGAFGIG